MRITDLTASDSAACEAVAELMFHAFADFAPDWLPTLDAARATVSESFGDERVSRVLLDDAGRVAGWAGGAHQYGRLWELHPLVVAAPFRRHGLGRQLVQDIAARAAERGALTLQVSTSDENAGTNLFARDPYPDLITALRELRSTRSHPIDFYLRIGFSLAGLMPDAEGPGKPSIYFAMRV